MSSEDGPSAGRGLGPFLRWLGGVDERLLDEVPTERARYTALGGVVLGTAVIAAFSMAMALGAVFGGLAWYLVPIALLWGVFVLNLDRWLVSSSSGSQWRRRAAVFLPRLVLAVFFGFVIAEPLVLRAFQTAIEEQIRTDRQQELADLEATLLRCNPEPVADAPPLPADCADHRISFESTPLARAGELAAKEADLERLGASVTADVQRQAELDTLASNECGGTPGPGLTGERGRGPECLRREREADDFRRGHRVDERITELSALREEIARLRSEVSGAQGTYQDALDTAVREQVDERRSHHGPIGLLERFQTLHDLIGVSSFLAIATWCIRFLFIAIDCLPVIAKLFSGTTSYDRLVDERLASAVRIDRERIRTVESLITADLAVQQHDGTARADQRRAEIDLATREHGVRIDERLRQAVDRLTSHFFTQPPGGTAPPRANPPSRPSAGPHAPGVGHPPRVPRRPPAQPHHRPGPSPRHADDDTVSFPRLR